MINKLVPLILLLISAIALACSSSLRPDSADDSIASLGRDTTDSKVQKLSSKLNTLTASSTTFENNITDDNLTSLQNDFKNLWIAWNELDALHLDWVTDGFYSFNILDLTLTLNTATLETLATQSSISSTDVSPKDLRGFSALDYLLFGPENSDTLSLFTDATSGSERLQLLTLLIDELESDLNRYTTEWGDLTSGVLYEWIYQPADGTYEFTDDSTILDQSVNRTRFILQEVITYRLGRVIGSNSNDVDLTESKSLYSRSTVELLQATSRSLQDQWTGEQGAFGLRSILLLNDRYDIIQLIEADMSNISTLLANITDLEALALSNWDQVDELRTAYETMLSHVELDLSTALGTALTFGAGDGD